MDFRERLSREERAEYDDLLYQAGFDDFGNRRRREDIKERMHELLLDALQAGRQWAQYVLDDDVRAGHLARFKRWNRQREVVHTKNGDAFVRRSAVMALRRKDPVTGESFWQDAAWKDMDSEELIQVIVGCNTRIASERIGLDIARRLLGLLEETSAETVEEALNARHMSLDEFLTGTEGVG